MQEPPENLWPSRGSVSAFLIFIPAGNEPGGHAGMSIWRLPHRCYLYLNIVQTDILIVSVLHPESAGDCAQRMKADSLIQMTGMGI